MFGMLPKMFNGIEFAGVGTIEYESLAVPGGSFLHYLRFVDHQIVEEYDGWTGSHISQFVKEFHKVFFLDALVFDKDVGNISVSIDGGQSSNCFKAFDIGSQTNHVSLRSPDTIHAVACCEHRLIQEVKWGLSELLSNDLR